jgi:hypothetical protein
MLEAFLIHFITQLRRDAGAGHPQGPSARALSFAMACPAPMRPADAQRYLAPVLHLATCSGAGATNSASSGLPGELVPCPNEAALGDEEMTLAAGDFMD